MLDAGTPVRAASLNRHALQKRHDPGLYGRVLEACGAEGARDAGTVQIERVGNSRLLLRCALEHPSGTALELAFVHLNSCLP